MQFFSFIRLLFKYLPQIISLLEKLEENIEEGILDFQVKRDNKKIEIIFKNKGDDAKRASDLNDIFRH